MYWRGVSVGHDELARAADRVGMSGTRNLEYFQKALEFIELSKEVDNLQALGDAFQKVVKEFGFDHYACVSCVNFGTVPDGAVFLAQYPEDWTKHYIANDLEKKDRILEVSSKRTLPFNWEDPIVHAGMREHQAEVQNEAADAGLLYGVTVPIHVLGAYPGAVNVVGSHTDVAPEAEHAIHLMGVYLHDAALRLTLNSASDQPRLVKLTAREQECLKWVAAGKTDWEIANILTIAERTAHTHIERAKQKLGVHTRVQAVVKAFLTNNIHL